jgi:hypothetical protein
MYGLTRPPDFPLSSLELERLPTYCGFGFVFETVGFGVE